MDEVWSPFGHRNSTADHIRLQSSTIWLKHFWLIFRLCPLTAKWLIFQYVLSFRKRNLVLYDNNSVSLSWGPLGSFICVWTTQELERPHKSTGSPKSSLFTYSISILFTMANFHFHKFTPLSAIISIHFSSWPLFFGTDYQLISSRFQILTPLNQESVISITTVHK